MGSARASRVGLGASPRRTSESNESGRQEGGKSGTCSHAAVQRLRPDIIADRAAALFRVRCWTLDVERWTLRVER